MTTGHAAACWPALGMLVSVFVTDALALTEARAIVEGELARADAAYSPWRADAEVARVNAARGTAVPIGELLLEAIEASLRAARLTCGAVDPTVGSMLRAVRLPSSRIRVRPTPGWQRVACDRAAGTVRLPVGLRLDLGAVGKALIADRAAWAVAKLGVGALVNVGGDLATSGCAPPDGWQVRLADDHRASGDGPVVSLRFGALATSSTTVRRSPDGSHHIIDPVRGRSAAGPWRTVSVAAESCVDANAASTAAIVFGEAAPQWLRDGDLPARLVAADGAVRCVGGWPAQRVAA